MPDVLQRGRPETCDCWVRFTASVDEDGNPSVTPLEIISTCEIHAAITSVEALHAAHLSDMAPKAAAEAVIRYHYANLLSWSIEADTRQILMLVDDSFLEDAEREAFRLAIEGVDGVDVSYRNLG